MKRENEAKNGCFSGVLEPVFVVTSNLRLMRQRHNLMINNT